MSGKITKNVQKARLDQYNNQGGGNSKCGVASRIARSGILARLLSRRATNIDPNSAAPPPPPPTC